MLSQLWPQHYPQAAWLAAAVPIAAGIDMETAKLAPLLLMAAIFVGVFGAAASWRLDWKRSLALGLMTSANPVIIVQLFTRMNDGQLGACFILTALFAALWSRSPRASLALAACGAMAYGLNLKFSAIPIFVLLSVSITFVTLASQGRFAALRVSGVLFSVGIVSVLILGAHPYVTNTLRHSHPFYPIMGQGAVDIMTGMRPAVLSEKGPIPSLVQSYFAVTSTAFSSKTMGFDDTQGLKLPFTFRRAELWASGSPDARLAGFGPLFSGVVLFAAGLGGWIAARNATRPRYIALTAALGLAVVSLSMPRGLVGTLCAAILVGTGDRGGGRGPKRASPGSHSGVGACRHHALQLGLRQRGGNALRWHSRARRTAPSRGNRRRQREDLYFPRGDPRQTRTVARGRGPHTTSLSAFDRGMSPVATCVVLSQRR